MTWIKTHWMKLIETDKTRMWRISMVLKSVRWIFSESEWWNSWNQRVRWNVTTRHYTQNTKIWSTMSSCYWISSTKWIASWNTKANRWPIGGEIVSFSNSNCSAKRWKCLRSRDSTTMYVDDVVNYRETSWHWPKWWTLWSGNGQRRWRMRIRFKNMHHRIGSNISELNVGPFPTSRLFTGR